MPTLQQHEFDRSAYRSALRDERPQDTRKDCPATSPDTNQTEDKNSGKEPDASAESTKRRVRNVDEGHIIRSVDIFSHELVSFNKEEIID